MTPVEAAILATATLLGLLTIIVTSIRGDSTHRAWCRRRAEQQHLEVTARVDLHLQTAHDHAVLAADAYRRGDMESGNGHHDQLLEHITTARKLATR